MKNILVTGANGLLGKSLALRLVSAGKTVLGVSRPQKPIKIDGVQNVGIDLSSNLDPNLLPEKIDCLLHLAQSSKFRDFPENALDVFNVNLNSTAQLLDYAKRAGAKQFVYASTGGVYENGSNELSENAPLVDLGKLGHYLGSKASGEILAHSYASEFQVVIIRPFFIYGPGQKRGMLIPRLFDFVSSGHPIQLQGGEGIRINPIHVEDASAAVSKILEFKGNSTFNIAGSQVLAIKQICDEIGKNLNKVPTYEYISGDPKDLVADISLMRSTLQEPQKIFSESIQDIAP